MDWEASQKIEQQHLGIPEVIGTATDRQANNSDYETQPPQPIADEIDTNDSISNHPQLTLSEQNNPDTRITVISREDYHDSKASSSEPMDQDSFSEENGETEQ